MVKGELGPGDRLLSERELAEKLEVSRASIREALKALEMLGVVEVRAGGTYITVPNQNAIIQPLVYALILDQNTTWELVEVRKMIEAQTARLAAVRRTIDDLFVMKDVLRQMKEALSASNLTQAIDTDFRFHWAVVNACHNKVLTRIFTTISDVFSEVLATTRKKLGRYPGMDASIFAQHLSIYSAIRNGNPEEAERLMREHIESLQEDLVHLERGESVSPPKTLELEDEDL